MVLRNKTGELLLSFAAGAGVATLVLMGISSKSLIFSFPALSSHSDAKARREGDDNEETRAESPISRAISTDEGAEHAGEKKAIASYKSTSVKSDEQLYQRTFVVGIDLGATNAKAGVLDSSGKLIGSASAPLKLRNGVDACKEGDSHSSSAVVAALVAVVHEAVAAADASLRQEGGRCKWVSDIKGVGVGSPGHCFNGVVHAAANFPSWKDVPLAALLQEALGGDKIVRLVNDADAALLGECWVGAASSEGGDKDKPTVCLVTLGSGIGGAVLAGGSLLIGSRGLIEPGHTIVEAGSNALDETKDGKGSRRLCGCGQLGCIEAYASANSVLKRFEECYACATTEYAKAAMERARAEERLSAAGHFRSLSRGGTDAYGDAVSEAVMEGAAVDSTKAVFKFAAQSRSRRYEQPPCNSGSDGNAHDVSEDDRLPVKVAAEVVNETARMLAIFAINLCRCYDPSLILFGGGMADAGIPFLKAIRQHFEQQRWSVLPDHVRLEFAQLGREAGVVGAAAVVRDLLES